MPKLAILDRNNHRGLRVREEQAFSVCKDIASCPVVLNEIPRLVIEYPLALARNDADGDFVCLALFGVEPDKNLFWQEGRWKSHTVPLNVGRQPFSVGLANATAGEGQQQLTTMIDLDNPGVQSETGEALFTESGEYTPYLNHKLRMLSELVDGELRTRQFCTRLRELELIQPIQLELKQPGTSPRTITGLHTINETKLRKLDAGVVADLNSRGYLHAIHAMLSSLGHLPILAGRAAGGVAPA